jgi:hypothetical protein
MMIGSFRDARRFHQVHLHLAKVSSWVNNPLGEYGRQIESTQGPMLGSQFSAIFWQFSVKKLAFFSKTNVMSKFLHNLALFLDKERQIFCLFFRQKYLKNHNIGPWV